MYAIKGSWVGQTFALAISSDSVGKKSRVRRSKEERKSMVETYIKRYQSSNNGSFPSLNLTHKEVGGSFYTVREIVREIIQENRVLGPAQFSPELQQHENNAAQYPLGSIASEHQAPFVHLENNQNDIINHQEKRIMELSLEHEEHYINNQAMESLQWVNEDENDVGGDLDDQAWSKSASKDVIFPKHKNDTIGGFSDGNQINGLIIETDNLRGTEQLVPGSLEIDEELPLIAESESHIRDPVDDLVVETFPLKSENNGTDDLGSLSTEFGNSTGNCNDIEVNPVDLSIDLTAKRTNDSQLSVTGRSPDIESNHIRVNGEVAQHTQHDLTNEAFNYLESPETKENTSALHNCMDQVSTHSSATSTTAEQHDRQVKTALKGSTTCLEDRTWKSNDKDSSYLSGNGNNNRRDENVIAANSPPVDRINLQSWERTTLKQQPNPLLAMIKSFADALIKFWS